MKFFVSILVCFFTVSSSFAMGRGLSHKESSKRIQEAVRILSPLAQSGVKEFKVKPAKRVIEMLYRVAISEKYVSNQYEFVWVGDSHLAWEADTLLWGETTIQEAYKYITTLDEDYQQQVNIQKAERAFKLLSKTGVKFGVVPMGANKCTSTLAALAIIDPYSGKIYVFAREPFSCWMFEKDNR